VHLVPFGLRLRPAVAGNLRKTFLNMRKIVTPLDIALLFGKSRRQASRILASVRKELGKKPHHKITVTEFAAYFGISTQEIEDIIFFNDN